jgi:hypothetical protein
LASSPPKRIENEMLRKKQQNARAKKNAPRFKKKGKGGA